MKSVLAFALLQLTFYVFGMSNASILGLIVLGSAVVLFGGAYLYAFIKDRQHQRKNVTAALELQ